MSEKATLEINGQKYDFPIINGSEMVPQTSAVLVLLQVESQLLILDLKIQGLAKVQLHF